MNSAVASLVEIDKQRICVIFPGALGDFICFLPALHRLANLSSVDLLAHSDFAAISPRDVSVQSLERFEVRQLFIDNGAADPSVNQFFSKYALIYSWFASQQPVFVEQLQKVSQGRAQIFPFRPGGYTKHQADYYLACLQSREQEALEPLVALRTDASLWCDAFLYSNGLLSVPLLIVAPGSGAREKNWPEAHFLQVAHWWRQEFGGKTVMVVGPVEEERRGYENLSSSCIVASGLGLAQLASLLARCVVYVGNDSGVSHLAAAIGVRTAAIFGPTDERQWAPRGPRVSVLRRQIACSPCRGTAMKLCTHPACLAEFSPQEVIHELRKLPEIANLTRLGVGITV